VISAPAGVLLARIMVPRDAAVEQAGESDLGAEAMYESSIDALIKGISVGLEICLKIGATLIVFVSIVAMVDGALGQLAPVGGAPISLERIFGIAFSPLAWCLGVPWKEAQTAGSLLGVKLMLTEFTAFFDLAKLGPAEFSDRSRVIMTYALCGFANIASVGINVAGYSILAPTRQKEIMGMVWKAMMVGFLATCMTASVVGVLPSALFSK
jgi:concentrative nucleoside transporter, CNT family